LDIHRFRMYKVVVDDEDVTFILLTKGFIMSKKVTTLPVADNLVIVHEYWCKSFEVYAKTREEALEKVKLRQTFPPKFNKMADPEVVMSHDYSEVIR